MERRSAAPRQGWQEKVESQGLLFHSPGGQSYWDESAYYQFSAVQIDQLEAATNELQARCQEAVQFVIDQNRFAELGIPAAAVPAIRAAWEEEPPAIYGRMDFSWDGRAAPKLLEYNADTPTGLLEAAVVQWYWLQDAFPKADQFNSIHERLVAKWKELQCCLHGPLYFAHSAGSVMALGAVGGIMALIALWRRLGLSPGMRVLANALVLGFAAIAGSIGYRGMLAAMGRNVTLTGRTTIWQAYFSRALDTWVFGAGPGSFTELSSATQDVGLRFQTLGRIYTPHNFFIAVFGETGIIGLLAYGLAFATILFNEWQVPHAKSRDLLQAFTLFFLISGLDETHEVFGVGAGIFMIMLIRAWGWPDRPAPVVNAPGLHGAT